MSVQKSGMPDERCLRSIERAMPAATTNFFSAIEPAAVAPPLAT